MTSAPFPWQRGLAWLQPVLCSQSDEQHWRKGSRCDGGPFYFPLRAPHYETRRSDLMAHRRNSSPKLSKLAANPPICEMWHEPFRHSRISFEVAWFCVGRCPSRSHLVVLPSCCQIRALRGEFAWYQLPRYLFLRHISFNAAVLLHDAQPQMSDAVQRSAQCHFTDLFYPRGTSAGRMRQKLL